MPCATLVGMVFEIAHECAPHQGWHVLPNRLNGPRLWFLSLEYAVSYCHHCAAGEGGSIAITFPDGSRRQRRIPIDPERGLVEAPARSFQKPISNTQAFVRDFSMPSQN